MDMQTLLKLMVEKEASDLHITTGLAPVLRIHGELSILEQEQRVTPEVSKELVYAMLSPEQQKKFEAENDLDFSYGIAGIGRFRVNAHMQRGSIAASIRLLATKIKSIEELGLPLIVEQMACMEKGMILVTGAAGSGKSTTLAAMIDIINNKKKSHIITIEDPIEYLYRHKNSVIEQREVGSDTKSFAAALKYTLRQDPNVILVGEMRDLETISAAITAAETGHLVLGTLHTPDAVQTIDRIIDVFPPHQQQQVRVQVSLTLTGVLCQQLIPRRDKSGRVAAIEIMVLTPAIRNLIREAKTPQIYSVLETGAKHGMRSMDASILELYSKDLIDEETALTRARDPHILQQKIAKLKNK